MRLKNYSGNFSLIMAILLNKYILSINKIYQCSELVK